MGRYILKRTLTAIVAFIGITIMTYCLASLMPGSPLDQYVIMLRSEEHTSELQSN